MHLVRFRSAGEVGVGALSDGVVRRLPVASMAELLTSGVESARALVPGDPVPAPTLLPPVDGRTEVWAAGVTYLRSREARVEESTQATIYDRVYDAERPELFFKAPAWRVVTGGEPLHLRADSPNDVAEPELAAVLDAAGAIVGWTVCNDLTARGIEGENPLYLPQAKIWDASCALAAGIRPAWEVDAADLAITMTIRRGTNVAFQDTTTTRSLRRQATDLAAWLYRETTFPEGAVLSTGTGIVPPLDLTLAHGDVVEIDIPEIGTLSNPVVSP